MHRLWLAGPVVVALGSATASRAPRLGYDLSGLTASAQLCGWGSGCDGGGSRLARQAEFAPLTRETSTPLRPRPASPGYWIDRPEPPPPGGVRILVSLPQQRLYLFRGHDLVATSPVSTGRRGHGTPAGTFHITQKDVHHRSNQYSNAPMPYMQRITNSGIALHAGRLPGYAASHGCIRLPLTFARTLFAITGYGTPVTITRSRPEDGDAALALVAPSGAPQLAAATPPEALPGDPLDEDYVSWSR